MALQESLDMQQDIIYSQLSSDANNKNLVLDGRSGYQLWSALFTDLSKPLIQS